MAEESPAPPHAPFDMELAATRRARAAASGPNFLMARLAADLEDRLLAVQRPFPRAVTLFNGWDDAAGAIRKARNEVSVTRFEAASVEGAETEIHALDAFGLSPLRFDLAVSLLAMQSVNDLPGFLIQARRLLNPDGLFLGCMLGAGSLQELRDVLLDTEVEMTGGASPRVAPFADVRDMGALLQRAGFALPVADVDALVLRHDTLFDLIRDLRQLGMTSTLAARSRKPLTRAFWSRAAATFQERHGGADGRISTTLNLIWVSGWAPDASQPKPLKPGSATVSLKDVL
jgi:SAM-dependent methyltransferase